MISANFMSCCMWMAYGLFGLNDVLVWGPNAIGLILTTVQIAVKLVYPSKDDIISADMTNDVLKSGFVVGDKIPEKDATSTLCTIQSTNYAVVSNHL